MSYSLGGPYLDSGGVAVTPESLGIYNDGASSMDPTLGDFNYGSAGSPSDYGIGSSAAGNMNGGAGAGIGAGIGAGLGILASIGQNNAYQAKMKQMATTTRYSPWTKMSMAQPTAPNDLGNILGYGASGAALGQGVSGGSMLPMALMAGGA